MPEALAIVVVFFVCIAIYFYARAQAADPSLQNPEQDRARLQQHAAWLQQRLRLAQQERWSSEMIAALNADLEGTNQALARSQARRTA